jgi:hypothetical protein
MEARDTLEHMPNVIFFLQLRGGQALPQHTGEAKIIVQSFENHFLVSFLLNSLASLVCSEMTRLWPNNKGTVMRKLGNSQSQLSGCSFPIDLHCTFIYIQHFQATLI